MADKEYIYLGNPKHVVVSGKNVSISETDGDPSQQVETEERVVDENGRVDYIAEAEEETESTWREKIATYLVHDAELVPHRAFFRLFV